MPRTEVGQSRIFYVYVCEHEYVYAPCLKEPWRLEQGVGSPGTGLTNRCEPLCWCWDAVGFPTTSSP